MGKQCIFWRKLTSILLTVQLSLGFSIPLRAAPPTTPEEKAAEVKEQPPGNTKEDPIKAPSEEELLRQLEMKNYFDYAQDFAQDVASEPLSYGLSSLAIATSIFIAYRFSKAGDFMSAAKAQLAAARQLKTSTEFVRYADAVTDLERTLLRYEQGLRVADDMAFQEWAKTADAKYVRYIKGLRKKPPTPGALVPGSLFKKPWAPGTAGVVDFALLHGEVDTQLAKTHEAAVEFESRAAKAGIALRKLKAPQALMAQGGRLARRLANPQKILAELNSVKGAAAAAELNALRLLGKDLVLKRGVRHWPGNGLRLGKTALWKMRYIILIGATVGTVYYLHKRQNAKDESAVLAGQANTLIKQDAEQQVRRELTLNPDALILMMQMQWLELQQKYKKHFDFECPFSFRNKGHQDLVQVLMSKATQTVSSSLDTPIFTKDGSYSVEFYREFWKLALIAARELSDPFANGPSLEALLGENLDGKGGFVDTLALRSADSFELAIKKVKTFHAAVDTFQKIATIKEQKEKLTELMTSTRRLVREGKVDPGLELTEDDLTILETELGLKDTE